MLKNTNKRMYIGCIMSGVCLGCCVKEVWVAKEGGEKCSFFLTPLRNFVSQGC
jgi:hypothetical protein